MQAPWYIVRLTTWHLARAPTRSQAVHFLLTGDPGLDDGGRWVWCGLLRSSVGVWAVETPLVGTYFLVVAVAADSVLMPTLSLVEDLRRLASGGASLVRVAVLGDVLT